VRKIAKQQANILKFWWII